MKIKVIIKGIAPLICNKFGDAAAMAASEGTSGSSRAQDRGTAHEVAEGKLYVDLDGRPCIPSPNLLRSMVDGGRFHKAGKSQITTARSSMLFSCLSIEAATIAIESANGWSVDTRAVRIPATGGRILAHRPIFNEWSLNFEIALDTSIVGEKLMRQIVDDAGSRIGLGDFRPATKGPYGRYRVDQWKVQKADLRAAA